MGFFSRKVMGTEAYLTSFLMTFGQAISSVEQSNNLEIPEAWDLFINKAGLLADDGLISQSAFDTLVYSSGFEVGRDLVIDLVALRNYGNKVADFAESKQKMCEWEFPPLSSSVASAEDAKKFIEFIARISQEQFPQFGSTNKDQVFYAILGIYLGRIYSDSENLKNSEKILRRTNGLTLGLQWFAEWNIAKDLLK